MAETTQLRAAHRLLGEWFERAMALDGAARRELIDNLREQEPALAAELAELVMPGARGAALLERPLVSGAASEDFESVPEFVGPYRLIEQIGRGGMGAVFLAEQEAPIRREVALKLIRGRRLSADLVARFDYERRVLARLDHPAIARILDAGTTRDGRPWFAMEHVQGASIDRWCEEHALDLASRLELVIEVCSAVEHAHRRGVLHLDIKPNNILVAEHEGRRDVKLIDFGIAQALEGVATSPRAAAAPCWRSPGYSAPECSGGGGIDVTSDVYSLGALLYTLVLGRGRRAADGSSLLEAFAKLDQAESATRARVLGVRPGALRRLLAADLDPVLAAALAPAPELRYGGPAALAADLRRLLANQPVQRAHQTPGYVIMKALKRRRRAVAVGSALLLGASALVVGSVVGLRAERDAAAHDAQRSRALAAFLVDTIRLADPARSLSPGLSVEELLDSTALRLPGALDGAPDSEAIVHAALGEAFLSLGRDADADAELSAAVRVMQADPERFASTLYRAAWSLVGIRERSAGRFALELVFPSIELRARLLEAADPALLADLAPLLVPVVSEALRAEVRALPASIEAARGRLAVGDPAWLLVADELTDLGLVAARESSDSVATDLLDEAAGILAIELPDGHPQRLHLEALSAKLELDSGRWASAEARLDVLLSDLTRTLPARHWRIAEVRSLLGVCLVARGEVAAGEDQLSSSATRLALELGTRSGPAIEARLRWLDRLAETGRGAASEPVRRALAAELARVPFGVIWWSSRPSLLAPPGSPRAAAVTKLLGGLSPLGIPTDDATLLARLSDATAGFEPGAPEAQLLARMLASAAASIPLDRATVREALARAALALDHVGAGAETLEFADAHLVLAEILAQRGEVETAKSHRRTAAEHYARLLAPGSASRRLAQAGAGAEPERYSFVPVL